MSIYKFPRNHNNKAPQKEKFKQRIIWSNWQAFERKGKRRKLLRTNLVPRVLSYSSLRRDDG